MAESGESAPKANELYLSIVDLFAIILPGAIIAFAVKQGFDGQGLNGLSLPGAEGWAVFLAASYVIGHLVSAIGSLLLDKIYDTGYKLLKQHSEYFRIRIRAKDVVQSTLKSFYSEKDNALEWAGIFARLASPAASTEIDRLEADSKFFRSLCVVLIVGWPIYIYIVAFLRPPENPPACWMRILALTLCAISLFLVVFLRWYVGKKEKAHARTDSSPTAGSLEDRVAKDMQSDEGLAVPCWKMARFTTLACAVLALASGLLIGRAPAFMALGCWSLVIFSSSRYMERRLKRTCLTYAYAIALSMKRQESAGPAT